MKINFKHITVALLVIILLKILLSPEPKHNFKIFKQRTIEKRIENKNEDITQLLNQVAVDRNLILSLRQNIEQLKVDLHKQKGLKDTAEIIKLQDIIINKQDTTIIHYQYMDAKKDSIIEALNFISHSKDSLLAVKDLKIRKKNKTICGLLGLNVVQTGIILLK